MKIRCNVLIIFLIAAVIGLLAVPAVGLAKEAVQQWELLNPEGIVKIVPKKMAPRISTLENKTVVLYWNGKDNGDNYLNRVAELLAKNAPTAKVIKLWEVDPLTANISQSPSKAKERAKKIVKLGADIVIGSQAD
jgi:hypothetical protein